MWLGLHHPDVLGAPSLNEAGSIPVLIHQCQAKPPPVARRGPGAGALVTYRPRQFSGVHLTLLPELMEFGALSLLSQPFPFTSPFFFPLPFYFSLFFSLPSLVLCSFQAGEYQPQPLICLIGCSYQPKNNKIN